jgi:hypothetical protein
MRTTQTLKPIVADVPSVEPVSAEPILISEKEVAFGTTAASMPTTIRRRPRPIVALLASVRPVPQRRHQPRRYAYLEYSCLAREMDRL